jgi:hypothetical protein
LVAARRSLVLKDLSAEAVAGGAAAGACTSVAFFRPSEELLLPCAALELEVLLPGITSEIIIKTCMLVQESPDG